MGNHIHDTIKNMYKEESIITRDNYKKILLLINHPTTIIAMSYMLKTLNGIKFHIPKNKYYYLKSNNENIYTDIDNFDDSLIDNLDIYNNIDDPSVLSCLIDHINKIYDMVIIIPQYFLSSNILNSIISGISIKIYIYQWGINGSQKEYFKIFPPLKEFQRMNSISFGFMLNEIFNYYSDLNIKVYITSLPINPRIFQYENKWTVKNSLIKKGIIIISRINSIYSKEMLLKPTIQLINNYNINLCFYGNNIGSNLEDFPYPQKFDQSLEELYCSFSDYDYFLYMVRELTMVQYSVLEAIVVGVPVLYFSNTLLAKLIDDEEDIFRCNSIEEMGMKIKLLPTIDEEILKKNLHVQKKALQYFLIDTARQQWINMFQDFGLINTI